MHQTKKGERQKRIKTKLPTPSKCTSVISPFFALNLIKIYRHNAKHRRRCLENYYKRKQEKLALQLPRNPFTSLGKISNGEKRKASSQRRPVTAEQTCTQTSTESTPFMYSTTQFIRLNSGWPSGDHIQEGISHMKRILRFCTGGIGERAWYKLIYDSRLTCQHEDKTSAWSKAVLTIEKDVEGLENHCRTLMRTAWEQAPATQNGLYTSATALEREMRRLSAAVAELRLLNDCMTLEEFQGVFKDGLFDFQTL